jgi:phospholipid/cholesterol/gamma-HCH transport system substrate-binding protein
MRRIAAIATALFAGIVLVAAGPAVGDEDPYVVRAVFDNATFLVEGEEVRIAGARVGTITEVDVSREDEIVSRENGGEAVPGKAVIVMEITDPAFQDFREDASCLIRPQSLLGEKFVECTPTQPRAPGTEPPPPLEEIGDGQPGEGQRLLPLENNGKSVDLDLIQNIQRLPYAERFRLILNELGAGLAARGDDLATIVERSNPALRQTNRVLAILARQNRTLARLAEDGDQVLAPLARDRERLAGFIRNAGESAAAAAERRGDLSAGLRLLPPALRDIRLTMNELQRFSDAAQPTLSAFGSAAPSLTRATAALGPFSRSATTSLTSLGDAAEGAGPKLRAADPIIRELRDLARNSEPAAVNLRDLLSTLRRTQGYERLMDFFFFTVGATNGFDQYGHFLRAILVNNNCNDYEIDLIAGCSANFGEAIVAAASQPSQVQVLRQLQAELEGETASRSAGAGTASEPLPPETGGEDPAQPRGGEDTEGPLQFDPEALIPLLPEADPESNPAPEVEGTEGATAETASGAASRRAGRALMRFLMEDGA